MGRGKIRGRRGGEEWRRGGHGRGWGGRGGGVVVRVRVYSTVRYTGREKKERRAVVGVRVRVQYSGGRGVWGRAGQGMGRVWKKGGFGVWVLLVWLGYTLNPNPWREGNSLLWAVVVGISPFY